MRLQSLKDRIRNIGSDYKKHIIPGAMTTGRAKIKFLKEPEQGPKRDASGSVLPEPENKLLYKPPEVKKYVPPNYK